MARIRTIKPEFWQDEKLAPLDPVTRLVFLGLISQADDAGRLLDNVKLLDGLLFPYTDDSSRDALDTLASLGRIIRYTSDSGQGLIQITNWAEHQRVDRPSKKVLPAPPPEPVAPQGDAEPSRSPRETVPAPSRNPIARTLDHGSRTMDLGPTTEDQDQNPAVAASPPQPARVREESSPPAAAAAAVAVVEVDRDQPDHSEHLQAMRQIVEATADALGDDLARRRLTGELELIITGDDVTAWQDARGDAVPWPDRPRLLRLALKRWELDRATYPKPRSALLYVIAQQYDPRPAPSISREAEAEHYQRHRDGAARRPASEPAAVGGLVGIDARPAADEPVDQSAQEWARQHRDQFAEILKDVAEAEGLDLEQSLERIQATGLALRRVREEVLAS